MATASSMSDEQLQAIAASAPVSSMSDAELQAIASPSVTDLSTDQLQAIAAGKPYSPGEQVRASDLQQIAARRGVDPSFLKDHLALAGATLPDAGLADTVAAGFGQVGEWTGLPFWAAKIGRTEEEKGALDDLRALVRSKEPSWTEAFRLVGGLGLGFALPFGTAAKTIRSLGMGKAAVAAADVAAGAATGALYGVAQSTEETELENALTGAILGGAIPAVIHGVPALYNKVGEKAAKKVVADAFKDLGGSRSVIDRAEKAYAAQANAERTFQEILQSHGEEKVSPLYRSYQTWRKLPDVDRQEISALVDDKTIQKFTEEVTEGSPIARKIMADITLPNEQQVIGGGAKTLSPAVLQDYLGWKRMQEDFISFAEAIKRWEVKTVGEAEDVIQTWKAQHSPEAVAARYRNYRVSQLALPVLRRTVEASASPEQLGPLQRMYRFMADARWVYRLMEDQTGLELVPIIDNLSTSHNFFTQELRTLHKASRELMSDLGANKISPTALPKVIDQPLDVLTGVKKYLAGEAEVNPLEKLFVQEGLDKVDRTVLAKAIKDTEELFEGMRNRANSLGLRITTLKDRGYIPRQLMPTERAILAMEKEAQSLQDDLIGLGVITEDGSQGTDLGEEAATILHEWRTGKLSPAFKRALQRPTVDGKTGEDRVKDMVMALHLSSPTTLNSPTDYVKAFQRMVDPELLDDMVSTTIRAASLRGVVGIPEFLRETDLDRLIRGWGMNTFRHAHFGPGIDRLSDAARTLRIANAPHLADYMQRHITDLMGNRQGTMASASRKFWQGYKIRWARKIEEAREKGTAGAERRALAAYHLPDIITLAAQNMYPYYLGLRPDAVLRNMTQPHLLTAQHISSPGFAGYGHKIVAAASLDSYLQRLKNLRTGKGLAGKLTMAEKEMQKMGFMPADFQGEAAGWVKGATREGFDEVWGSAGRVGKATMEKVNQLQDMAMWLYKKSDSQSRLVSWLSSKRVMFDLVEGRLAKQAGKELTKDQQAAQAALGNLSSGYRSKILRELDNGQGEQAIKSYAEALNGDTLFNYNKASLSEYGRTVGGLFAMFTKWPTTMLGELGYFGLSKGAFPTERKYSLMAQKYLAPLIGFYVLEKILPTPADSSMREIALGHNVMTWAPASSLAGIATGKFLPPVVDVPFSIIGGLLKGEPKQSAKAAARAAVSVVPGAVFGDFMLNDLEKYQDIFGN